jgi:hypothetical protein
MVRRNHLTLTLALVVAVLFTISYLFSGPSTPRQVGTLRPDEPAIPLKHAPEDSRSEFKVDIDAIPAGILEGESIAPKLENATLK